MFDPHTRPAAAVRGILPTTVLDRALTAQLVVGWAGEGGEEPRLGWWRSDLVAPYGGLDLFTRLLPATALWAVLQGAREAARRTDAERRRRADDPDRIRSLFSLGFDLDEQIDERLQDLKRSGDSPGTALPALSSLLDVPWNRERFLEWVRGQGEATVQVVPIGREIKSVDGEPLDRLVGRFVAALAPLADMYPLPHYRRPQ